jgi:hypothetical protein
LSGSKSLTQKKTLVDAGSTQGFFFVTILTLLRELLATWWSWELLGKFSKKLPQIFKEESYEIAKTFEELGRIFRAFPLLKSPYLANRF